LPALDPSPKIPKSTHHRPKIHGPHIQHATDDPKYERNLLVSKKNGDVSIAIGAFADMDRLPDFDEMVVHPALLVPQNIPVDEDAILPYFPNLVEAVPSKFNATPLSWHTTFCFMNSKLVLHYIWPHSIKLSPDQPDSYDTPNDTFCNSQILSQNVMSKPIKEDNDASLLAMENRLFDRLLDAMQYQSQAIRKDNHGRHCHR
jgi:hypothetical protein